MMRLILCSSAAIALLAACAASSTPEAQYASPASAAQVPPMPVDYVPPPSRLTGRDTYNAEKLAKNRACAPQPFASLSAKGPGFEAYSVPCSNGRSIAIYCEFGNCKVLQ